MLWQIYDAVRTAGGFLKVLIDKKMQQYAEGLQKRQECGRITAEIGMEFWGANSLESLEKWGILFLGLAENFV